MQSPAWAIAAAAVLMALPVGWGLGVVVAYLIAAFFSRPRRGAPMIFNASRRERSVPRLMAMSLPLSLSNYLRPS